MLPLERHRLIVELLGQRGVMRVNEIAQATRVSRETIRRDLSELERKGILNRSHAERWRQRTRCRRSERRRPPCRSKIAREAFSRERCCTVKEKCALPAKRCSVSSRDRPSSWTAAAPAGFWPADAGDDAKRLSRPLSASCKR